MNYFSALFFKVKKVPPSQSPCIQILQLPLANGELAPLVDFNLEVLAKETGADLNT